jgi:putative ABC transport system permease protein
LGAVDEDDVRRLLGKKLRLEYRSGRPPPSLLLNLLRGGSTETTVKDELLLQKVLQRLPDAYAKLDGLSPEEKAAVQKLLHRPEPRSAEEETVFTTEFTIRGVLSTAEGKVTPRRREDWVYSQADVFLPARTAEELFFRLPSTRENGFESALVEVDHVDNVKEVSQEIRDMGLRTFFLIELIEREQFTYVLLITGMTVVAVIALIVSALGLINTMLMSVLERVREIGIMKAVGARDGHIQMIFLVEGAVVGLVGGLLGLLLGWAVSFPIDAYMHAMVARRMSVQLQESIFVFPWWLLLLVLGSAVGITTLAAIYPARRAVRVNPIAALRHD